MNSPSKSTLAAAIAVFFVPCPLTVCAGDNLADREVLPVAPEGPISGTTAGMGTESGEINEARLPAARDDRSVWYEWTAETTGTALWSMEYVTPSSSNPIRGIAAYTVTGDGPVTMEGLIPAGAVVLPPTVKQRGLRLWVTAGQRIILRVWTKSSFLGNAYNLHLRFLPRGEREPRELLSLAQPFYWVEDFPDGTKGLYDWWGVERDTRQSTEAADVLIGGKYYPDGAAIWHRWTAERADTMRVSFTGLNVSRGTLIVAEESQPGGPLNLVAGPGKNLTFTPVPGREYLIRESMTVPTSEYVAEFYTLDFGVADPADEPSGAVLLAAGESRYASLRGSSQSSLTFTNTGSEVCPDTWFDLGSSLSGPHVLTLTGPLRGLIYTTDAAGNPGPVVAGGGGFSQRLSFLAVPGLHYMARVYIGSMDLYSRGSVSLLPQLEPAPANDSREGAELLPADGPVLLQRNAVHATAGATDWLLESSSVRGRGPTVWYALDRPASPQPWIVRAANGPWQRQVLLLREENGVLVKVPLSTKEEFTFTGGRVWIMVDADYGDPYFTLMAAPAVTPGASPADASPLTAGETQFFYTGAATANAPLPDAAESAPPVKKMWLSWTAPADGLVLFSTSGSLDTGSMRAAIYTDALERVPATSQLPESLYTYQSEILSFQAVAGTSYRIALYGDLSRTAVVRLQPGGWDSPYEVWLLSQPAWKDVPSLTDPEADADGDGVLNVMEMACGLNVLVPEPNEFPAVQMRSFPAALRVDFEEKTAALRGVEGCHPFTLTWESSADGLSWMAETPALGYSDDTKRQLFWERTFTPGEDPPSRMFRLRVSR